MLRPEELTPFVTDVVLQAKAAGARSDVRTDENGEATFTGLAAESVFVVARDAGRIGFAGPVELRPGDVTVGPQVVVSASGSARVVVTGGTEWLPVGAVVSVTAVPNVFGQWIEPARTAWTVLGPTTPTTALPFAGRWRFDLSVVDSGRGQRIDSQEVDVGAGDEVVVPFSIDRARYSGRVLVGGRAVAGRLTLLPDGASRAAEYSADVATDGRFDIWLPEDGVYAARFVDTARTMALRNTKPRVVHGSELLIRFQVAQLSGVVTLPDGSRAAAANVWVEPTIGEVSLEAIRAGVPQERTNDKGQFVFHDLEPGSWEVLATWNGRAARSEPVVVQATGTSPSVRLVLGEADTVTGRVVNEAGQPVPAARVRFGVETGSATAVPPAGVVSTDADGYFSMKVGAYVGHQVQIAVAAAGHPLAAFRVPTRSGLPALVNLPSAGGRVDIALPTPVPALSGGPDRLTLYTLVNEQGGMLPLADAVGLFRAGAVTNEPGVLRVVIPSLAAGPWRLADFRDPHTALLYMAGFGPLQVAAEFTVRPGLTQRVDLR